MNKRKLSVLTGIFVLILSIPLAMYISDGDGGEARQEAPTEIIQVPVVIASPGTLDNKIRFTGRVIPQEQFDIYAEVTGRMTPGAKPFKTGIAFDADEILLHLNDDELRQQVVASRYSFASQLSRILPDVNVDYPNEYPTWKDYLDDFDAEQPLKTLPETDNTQFRLFLNSREIYSSFANIRQQEIRLDKFTIEAPFSGVLTESLVDPGSLIQPGQRLGQFTKIEPLELEASIPATQYSYIKVGDQVKLNLQGPQASAFDASILRKNARIEPNSQTVRIFIQLENSGLTPGMYLEGFIQGSPFENAVRLHQDVLVRDNQLFVIQDSIATIRQVTVLSQAGDSVTVTEIDPGTVIIDDFRNAAFEGSRVEALED